MPLCLAIGRASLWNSPQDVRRRAPKPRGDEHAGSCTLFGCLTRRGGQRAEGLSAVRKLTGDVAELMQVDWAQDDPHIQCAEPIPDMKVKLVSQDVQRQVRTILDAIKQLHGQEVCSTLPAEDAVGLLEQLIDADLPVQLLEQLPHLEFDARGEVMKVCCALLWSGTPAQMDKQVVEYLRAHPRFFPTLVEGYAREETALHCGVVLRSCARHRELVEAFFGSGKVCDLVRVAQQPGIDIASDAFYTLREMLLDHKDVSATWLDANFQDFFQLYNDLLQSEDYIAERIAQKLLVDMFLDPHFPHVMLRYVSNERNLAINMNLLKDRSRSIQMDAFHVFKFFVRNPRMPAKVRQILFNNKDRLLALLEKLRPSRLDDDEQFVKERRTVMERLRALTAPVPIPTVPLTAKTPCASGRHLSQ